MAHMEINSVSWGTLEHLDDCLKFNIAQLIIKHGTCLHT